MSEVYKIKSRRASLADVSFTVRIGWTLGTLSELLKVPGVSEVPKKHLRQALEIIKNPKLEVKILEKGKEQISAMRKAVKFREKKAVDLVIQRFEEGMNAQAN